MKKGQRGLDFFYNPINIDSIILPNSKVVFGAFIDEDLFIFYNLKIGIISFSDQFQNKWTLLN